MANPYFQFKQFTIFHDQCGMKVTTDACLFGALIGKSEKENVLDIGAGTGLLSLMIAQRFPSIKIDAIEIDESAYNQAIDNVKKSSWSDRITLHHQAIQQYEVEKQYDLLVTNPPFFPEHLKSPDAQKNKALHTDSLPFSDLLKSIKRLLKPDGTLQIMLPAVQYQDFKKMASHLNLRPIQEIKIYNKPDKPIFRVIAEMSFQETDLKTSEIYITDSKGDYTEDFQSLLKDYYLKL